MNLLALDLSLRSIGWAANHALGPTSGIYGAEDLVDFPRLVSLRDDTLRLAQRYRPDLILIEDMILGISGGTALKLAGLGYVIRLTLFEAGYQTLNIAPATLKRFATGKGNAVKEQMVAAARAQLGYKGNDHNAADALWLLHAGMTHFRLPGHIDSPHRDCLAVVHWPNPVAQP